MRGLAIAVLALAAAGPAGASQDPAAASTPDLSAVAGVVGAPRGGPLAGAALDAETKRVGALLRCPVCQGVPISDSPAEMAVNMLSQVREMLAAGYTEPQIVAYFEHSYGEFVRLEPKLAGLNWMLWLAPLLGVAIGGLVLVVALRRPRAAAAEAADAAIDGADPRLAEYVQRVRALVATGLPKGPSQR